MWSLCQNGVTAWHSSWGPWTYSAQRVFLWSCSIVWFACTYSRPTWPHLFPSHSSNQTYQSTSLPVKWSEPVLLEHSTTFPFFCCTCPNLFKTWFQHKHLTCDKMERPFHSVMFYTMPEVFGIGVFIFYNFTVMLLSIITLSLYFLHCQMWYRSFLSPISRAL